MNAALVSINAVDKAKLWLLRRSVAGRKIGRTFTTRDAAAIAPEIYKLSRCLGGKNGWGHGFAEALSGWIKCEQTHQEVTAKIIRDVENGPKLPEAAAVASQLSAAFGLFEASLEFEHRSLSGVANRSLGGHAEQQRIEVIR